MKKYCYLQCKRLARYLPGALCVVVILLGGLLAAFSMMVRSNAQADENQKVRIAMVGTADDTILQMGLAAMRSVDSTQFSLELVEMDEAAAMRALQLGQVGACIVLPEGFMDEAMNGNILPVKFITAPGSAGMVTIFKEEVSTVISSLLLESQQGVYGMHKAMSDHDVGGRGKKMTDLALIYTDYVLARDQCYSLESLGISDSLGLEGYLLCGLAVLFLMLACLPFAPLMIRRDLSLARMLASRGRSALGQTLCDLAVYAGGLLVMVAVLLGLGALVAGDRLGQLDLLALLLRSLPVLLMVACFSFMLYALSTDLIGGLLLQFFAGLSLCFVSGCMYPVYFFPVAVQKLAVWLPTGLARSQLAGSITGSSSAITTLALLAYALVFGAVGVLARLRAVKEARV